MPRASSVSPGDGRRPGAEAIVAEHIVPMAENIELARALAREVQIRQPIRATWCKPVAKIIEKQSDFPSLT